MLWAAFTIVFYGFLRVSEYTTLHWSDVSVTEENLSIKLHQSKTDPFRRGHTMSNIPYSCIHIIYVLHPCALGFGLRSVCDICF